MPLCCTVTNVLLSISRGYDGWPGHEAEEYGDRGAWGRGIGGRWDTVRSKQYSFLPVIVIPLDKHK